MENKQLRQCVIPLHKPSLRELAFFFVSGIVLSFPFAYFFESLYQATWMAALLVIALAPLIEELAKVFPLFYRHGETERSVVTIGLLIGLGFGLTEFIEYTIFAGASPLARIPGVVFHASSATITAYGVAKKNPLPYYLIAVFLHAANNFIAFATDILSISAELLILITVYLLAWRYYHQASKEKIVF
jgi:RsiW-degrading membrane proteinase PrsW (M82 family)